LKSELSRISHLLTGESGLNHTERRQYLTGMAQVTRHLNRKHRLVGERHYVKRFVSVAVALGLGLVGLGYLLLSLGITLIVFTLALPALVGRIVFSYLVGLFMDRRAKKRGRVI
jgi:Flp pilus assembly protein TadB